MCKEEDDCELKYKLLTFQERVTFYRLGTWFECQVSFIVAHLSVGEWD